jgi:hypothetical protein
MRKNIFTTSMNIRLLAVALLLPSLNAFCATATNSAAAKTTSAPAAAPIVIATSEFVIPATVTAGRDPFFPARAINTSASASTNTAAPVSLNFILQGVSGTKARRFALINGRTFGVGEEAELTAGKSKVRVTCISIEEDSCIIESGGRQQMLKLKPGL